MRSTIPRLAALLFPALVSSARPAMCQIASHGHASVRGTVTDAGRPLAGVLVMRLGSADSTRTDSLGRFAIEGLGAGRHIFEVRKRRYAPIEMEVNLPTDSTQIRAGIPMEAATAGDPELVQKLDREGFSERRRRAQERDHITFLGPEDLAGQEAVRVSQLFDGVRDVVVRFERGISVLYGDGGRCVMAAWIEHQWMETAFPPAGSAAPSARAASSATHYSGLDDLIPLGQIAAIEVYPRPSQVPQEYHRSSQQVAGATRGREFETRSAECGAVIFWTR